MEEIEEVGADITRLSLEELGLAPDGAGDGYPTDPDSMRRAAGPLDDSAATLWHAAGAVSRVQLVARLLGEVPAAETFSAAANRFIAERATTPRQRHGRARAVGEPGRQRRDLPAARGRDRLRFPDKVTCRNEFHDPNFRMVRAATFFSRFKKQRREPSHVSLHWTANLRSEF